MSKMDFYITTSGWEDRSFLSADSTFKKHSIGNTIVFYTEEYQEKTAKNFSKIKQLSNNNNAQFTEVQLILSDHKLKWQKILKCLERVRNATVLLDITTMPRDIIWYVLHFLMGKNCEISVIYGSPKKYGDWLSKDPGKPILLYNHSGITKLENQTALLIVSGFDVERASQLIQYYEPKKTYLALQSGEKYENHKKNIEKNIKYLSGLCEIESFQFDSFSNDGGYRELVDKTHGFVHKYNVIASSLGPKPSAVALFRLNLKFPEIALCYVPSTTYNTEDYTSGLESILDMTILNSLE